MSEEMKAGQIKTIQTTEMTTEELDVVAGGASLDSFDKLEFEAQAFAQDDQVENGGDGFKRRTSTVAKTVISNADSDRRLEI